MKTGVGTDNVVALPGTGTDGNAATGVLAKLLGGVYCGAYGVGAPTEEPLLGGVYSGMYGVSVPIVEPLLGSAVDPIGP